jgi:hypothetical protein
MSSRRNKTLFAVAGLAALALLGWFLLREERPEPLSAGPVDLPSGGPHAGVEAPGMAPSTQAPRGPERQPSGEPVPPIARLPPPAAPVIEEVSVDKKSVCFNEDVRVTVKARTPGGADDAFLRYRVGGEAGPVVSLRRLSVSSQGGLPERGGYTVSVTGRDGTHATVPLPDIEVKDCRLPNEFELVHSLEPGSEDVVRLTASPIGHNPDIDSVVAKGRDDNPFFHPVRYVWSFDDGTTVETTEGTVVHDFSARAQTALYSYFLVRCEAFDAKGDSLGASKAIELKNPAFEAFMTKGTVRLLAQPGPATADGEGRLTVPVRLWHQWGTPITVKAVKLRRHRSVELQHADERNPPSRPAVEELFPDHVLGASRIASSGIVTQVQFEPERDRDVAAKEFRLEGETAEGWPVKGSFMTIRPGLDPVVRRMLVDGEWRSKVLRARAHLDKADVTEKEVMDLEGEGLYVELPRAFRGTPPPGFSAPAPVAQAEEW